jgi:predicted ATPase
MHLKKVTLQAKKYPTDQHYPFNLPLFHKTGQLVFHTPVTLFAGENGTGKSTLLEALARACNIHIWRNSAGNRPVNNPYEETLYKFIEVEWSNGRVPGSFFGSKIFQHFTELLDEWAVADPGQLNYFGGKSLTTQSHGQSLMSFFHSRYSIKGLYLLDEPETALSPRSQIDLLDIIQNMSAAGHAQFIIATHSPLLLACPQATIYDFNSIPVRKIAYEETDHYRIYKDFLEDRKKYIPTS